MKKKNVFIKILACVLVAILAVSVFLNIEKTNEITDLKSRLKSATSEIEKSYDASEYEKIKSENQNLTNANSEYSKTIEDLRIENTALIQERNSIKNRLSAALASHTVVYIDENFNYIYSERVQSGEDVENIPTPPEKSGFHSEWSTSGTDIQSDTVIYPRYYHILTFNYAVQTGFVADVIFDKSEPIKIYGDEEIDVTTNGEEESTSLSINGETILTATLTDDHGYTTIWAKGWYLNNDISDIYFHSATFDMDEDVLVTAYIGEGACILAGSKISMADGTEKNVEDIQSGDYVMSYDYRVGSIQPKKVLALISGNSQANIFTVKLNNGGELKIADIEYIFDTDAKKFIEVSAETLDDLVGRNIMINNDGTIASAQITSVETSRERVDHYTMYVEDTNNYIANGIVAHIPLSVMNIYKIGDDFKVDADQYAADVAQYGTYTYDEFKDVISEEIFNAFNIKDAKFAVEKGLVSYEVLHNGIGIVQREIDVANQNCK